MPEKNSNPKDREHAELVAKTLGIKYIVSDITDILKALELGVMSLRGNLTRGRMQT